MDSGGQKWPPETAKAMPNITAAIFIQLLVLWGWRSDKITGLFQSDAGSNQQVAQAFGTCAGF